MKKLIIAEKPSLSMNIVQGIGAMQKKDGYFENSNYIVTFAFGHLLRLKDVDEYKNREKTNWKMDDLPFFPERFEYKLPDDNGIRKQFKIITTLYQREDVNEVINAGDPDREGCVIINNIVKAIQNKTNIYKSIKRVWLTATTPEFVSSELNNLKANEIYENYYQEGLTRTYVDWLYGINISRYLSIKAGTFLPVGRVLIPIINFIYERDRAIKNFKKETFYELVGSFEKSNVHIVSTINNTRCDNQEKAKDLLKSLGQSPTTLVEKVSTKAIKKQPPKLFSLDKLQNQMNKLFHYSSSQTLETVQGLYEKGYVTYPRTNTEYLATAEKSKIQGLINQVCDKFKINLIFKDSKAIFDDSKIEGHTALIITTKFPDINKLNEVQSNVYKAILNRFIANFLNEETIIQETKVTIAVSNDYKISLSGNTILEPGYLKYEPYKKESMLPVFNEGDYIPIEIGIEKKYSQPPTSVTEAELNQFLKNPFKKKEIKETDDDEYKTMLSGCEIGTVATRANIIENAIKYQYIDKQKNSLKVTEKGIYLIETLKEFNIDLSREKTVELGMLLKAVFNGNMNSDSVIKSMQNEISAIIKTGSEKHIKQLSTVQDGICKCPNCGGQIREGEKNYYCSEYKNGCMFSIWKNICNKKITKTNIKQLCTKRKTSKIKGFTGKKGTFDAFLILDNQFKVNFSFK